MSDKAAEVTPRRTISPIWIVPIVAVVLGAWMVWFTFQQQGPEITLVFSTAEGIEAGKTKIRARSVTVGLVSSVGLSDDLERVVVVAELEKAAERLLRQDTEFWVVRPRVGAGGVTGLGTILSGGYIELAPGTGKAGRREFVGLENVPVTPIGTPGLHLSLVSDEAGSVSTGDPILYDGYRVGRVEKSAFDVETREMRYEAFIEEPYDSLVTTGTLFWNSSGLHFSATADGIEFSTGSLQSLVVGGVTFHVPENTDPGAPAVDGALFALHPKEPDADDQEYRESIEYVVRFARSVRGLRPGAPVEYRGLHAGQVERLLLSEMVHESGGSGEGAPIPVLISMQPGRLEFGDDAEGRAKIEQAIERGAANGLRATLATGNLLTGSLYVALDMYPDAAPAGVGSFAGRPTIPTVSSGFEGLQQQAQALLEKLNALPVEDVVGSADATLQELNSAVAALNAVIRSDGIQSLPDQLELTLAELDRTLRKVSDLAASLESQPSSLIFSRTPELDPEPAAGAP